MSDTGPIPGIDVSHHNGAIDWGLAARAGIAFAYTKATEGVAFTDRQFRANWAGIRNAGLLRGAYHFFRPALPAAVQAERSASLVGTPTPGDLPPMLDLEETSATAGEDEWSRVAKSRRVALAIEWLERVERALGQRPIVYTRAGFLSDVLGTPGPLTQYPIWLAQYTNQPQPRIPAGWERWTLWQYSQTGRIPGLACALDMDRFNGSLAELRALAGA